MIIELNISAIDSGLSGGSQEISYTTTSGDTPSSIATHLTSSINGNANLQSVGISATSSGAVITITSISPNGTTYTQSVTTGSETIALSNINNGFLQSVNGPLPGNEDVSTFTMKQIV